MIEMRAYMYAWERKNCRYKTACMTSVLERWGKLMLNVKRDESDCQRSDGIIKVCPPDKKVEVVIPKLSGSLP